jgi:hypothetical protein
MAVGALDKVINQAFEKTVREKFICITHYVVCSAGPRR